MHGDALAIQVSYNALTLAAVSGSIGGGLLSDIGQSISDIYTYTDHVHG